jgi:DNA-3-methyladenine glycosylase II
VLGGREVRIEAAPGGVRIDGDGAELPALVRRYLGEPFDLDAFAAFALTEPVLERLVPALRGFRPPLVPDPFEALVTSITAQQISLRAAFSIRNRLIAAFGERHAVAYAFPTCERLAAARPEEIVAVGFSRRKAEYVIGLARSELDLDGLGLLPDEEVKATLVSLPGLGEWTADWFLARHLGRPDAWPAGDLGLRKAVLHFYGDDTDVRAAGARFSRFANLAAHYLLVGHRVHG